MPARQGPSVTVIGAGLAGSEAAWQAASLGAAVTLYEMRPQVMTPAHQTGLFAELVCSNSLGADELPTAGGLLKEEMRRLGSLVIRCARESSVAAGGALAVDREFFSQRVTEALQSHPRIRVVREEVDRLPQADAVVIATGPLTSERFAPVLAELTGQESLYFYDAAAPIVTAESVDPDRGFWASRYGKGGADYLNLPLNREQYLRLEQELRQAERHEGHLKEELKFFEGCIPVEEMADRGEQTLRFGPLKPVGLIDPKTGRRPYAVVQLRKEDREGRLLNLVGFQTRLKWGEQRRIFRLIPGLENAEFVRYGVIHRNTFVNSPRVLLPSYGLRRWPRLFLAGLITGVEGYVESAASGLLAGINAVRAVAGQPPLVLPPTTMMGALAAYVTTADPEDFQPMNAAFGLLPPVSGAPKDKQERRRAMVARALEDLEAYVRQEGERLPARSDA